MWVSLIFLLSALSAMAQPIPTVPALPSPTPIPTATPIPTVSDAMPRSQVWQFLATAAANVNAMPADVSSPGGVAILPNADARIIFSYGKWLFSGSSADELLGRTLSPFALHAFAAFTLIVVLVTIYLLVYLATLVVKAITWIIQQVLRVLPFFG